VVCGEDVAQMYGIECDGCWCVFWIGDLGSLASHVFVCFSYV